jgi:acylphosphatase
MNIRLCKKYIISGHVQGVWFRASTQEQAKKLNITGWAKNLPDGNVEVIACGMEYQLNILHQWLIHGPKNASVDSVSCDDFELFECSNFQVK